MRIKACKRETFFICAWVSFQPFLRQPFYHHFKIGYIFRDSNENTFVIEWGEWDYGWKFLINSTQFQSLNKYINETNSCYMTCTMFSVRCFLSSKNFKEWSKLRN